MKKVLFLCALCACICSCTDSEMQEKKAVCQTLCDSLYVSETKSWEIIETRNAEWHERKRSMVLVGTTPVPRQRTVKAKGSLLLMENGQVVRTNYVNVPVGAYIVQKSVYVPKKFKDGNQKGYRPFLQKYEHYIFAGDKYHLMEDFDLLKLK